MVCHSLEVTSVVPYYRSSYLSPQSGGTKFRTEMVMIDTPGPVQRSGETQSQRSGHLTLIIIVVGGLLQHSYLGVGRGRL